MNSSIFRNFLKIIDTQTIVIVSVTFIATALCIKFNFAFSIPLEMIGIAIIFPIVFSINAAYTRREKALDHYANIKALCVSLFQVHRDAVQQPEKESAKRISALLTALLREITMYFSGNASNQIHLRAIYSLISRAHQSSAQLKEEGLTASEATVVFRYCNDILTEFEKLKNIYTYRTPISLRAYSQIFLNIFPVLFAPYFAHLSIKNEPVLGFMVGGLYSILLVSLDNIQEDLENPFDQKGTDDITFDGSELIQAFKHITDTDDTKSN